MWKEVRLKLTGASPFMMHNPRLANPLDPLTKIFKPLSAKRNKTDADLEELSRLEFQAGLYYRDNGKNGDQRPIIPDRLIEAAIYGGAKKSREGKIFKSGVMVDSNATLLYDGPTARDKLFADGQFTDTRMVVVSRSRIMRTRPIFNEWAADVTVRYDDQVLNLDKLVKWTEVAGREVGLGEMRPKLGKFTVEVID